MITTVEQSNQGAKTKDTIDQTSEIKHRPEVASTVANRSILPHSDWLASANRSKPIIMPYLPIFATVSFNVTVAKICKYSAMIG